MWFADYHTASFVVRGDYSYRFSHLPQQSIRLEGGYSMYATLVVVVGTTDKRQLNIHLPAVLGRSRQADLTIAHGLVSRKHCELREHEGAVVLTDLGSLNGTFCRDRRIQRISLMPHDRFSIGPLTFEIRYDPDPQDRPASGSNDTNAMNAVPIELSDGMLPVPVELDDPVEPSGGIPAGDPSLSVDKGQTIRIDLPPASHRCHSVLLDVPTSQVSRDDKKPPDH